jgi:hypothetical protein
MQPVLIQANRLGTAAPSSRCRALRLLLVASFLDLKSLTLYGFKGAELWS